MNQDRIKVIEVFKNNLVNFIEILIEQFPTETDLIIIRTFFLEMCSAVDIINYFSHKLLNNKVKTMIEKQNDQFFIENDTLFSDIKNKQKVFHFKNVWLTATDNQKKSIWQWFNKLVRIAEIYKSV
jgi:DNA-binding protein